MAFNLNLSFERILDTNIIKKPMADYAVILTNVTLTKIFRVILEIRREQQDCYNVIFSLNDLEKVQMKKYLEALDLKLRFAEDIYSLQASIQSLVLYHT